MIRLQKLFIRKVGQFSQIAARRPELDFDRLLNPENLASIRENIRCRKQVGDIDQLHRLWNNLQTVIQDKNPTMTMNELTSMWDRFYEEALLIPNDTHPEAPVGKGDESVAKIIHTNGSKPIFTFKPLFGEDIAVKFKILWQDVGFFCGEKAYFLYNQLAILELALIQFCRDRLRSSGFEEVVVPDVIPKRIVENCGLMNRTDKEIVYSIHGLPNWTLSGTAEMGLASFIENRIFDVNEMPKKFFSVSRCFRPEVATGKLSKGLYRVHEFTKVEMFICTANETGLESNISHLEILEMQKLLFSELNLHFNVLEMPTEELGASAFRKFDIESWFPGRDCYGEISSASNCTDYQSRRLSTKYKSSDGNLKFVHTVNGTACALSRTLIAMLEQFQCKNRQVNIPKFLLDYVNVEMKRQYAERKPLSLLRINPKTVFEC